MAERRLDGGRGRGRGRLRNLGMQHHAGRLRAGQRDRTGVGGRPDLATVDRIEVRPRSLRGSRKNRPADRRGPTVCAGKLCRRGGRLELVARRGRGVLLAPLGRCAAVDPDHARAGTPASSLWPISSAAGPCAPTPPSRWPASGCQSSSCSGCSPNSPLAPGGSTPPPRSQSSGSSSKKGAKPGRMTTERSLTK